MFCLFALWHADTFGILNIACTITMTSVSQRVAQQKISAFSHICPCLKEVWVSFLTTFLLHMTKTGANVNLFGSISHPQKLISHSHIQIPASSLGCANAQFGQLFCGYKCAWSRIINMCCRESEEICTHFPCRYLSVRGARTGLRNFLRRAFERRWLDHHYPASPVQMFKPWTTFQTLK